MHAHPLKKQNYVVRKKIEKTKKANFEAKIDMLMAEKGADKQELKKKTISKATTISKDGKVQILFRYKVDIDEAVRTMSMCQIDIKK